MEKANNIPHGSEEWYNVRKGRFTPSELHRLMTEPKLKTEVLSAGAITYIKEKLAESLTADFKIENEFQGNAATAWGNAYEDEAINIFADMSDTEIIKPGFILANDVFGGTPDGVSADNSFGIEVKCPYNPAIHLDNLLLTPDEFKKARKEYYWQIQGYILLTGIPDWYFISYDPRQTHLCIKYIQIKKNEEDIELIKKKLKLATDYKQQLLNKLKQ